MNLALRRLAQLACIVVMAFAVATPAVSSPVRADTPIVGSQGSDTSLPLTDSAVTVSGRGATFGNMKVTVNQTADLAFQAISLTWSGAPPTITEPGFRFHSQFVQVMQCWGDDDGTNPDNPGPPPTQCEFGAASGQNVSSSYPSTYSTKRVIGGTNWPNYDPNAGFTDTAHGLQWSPFKSVTGDVVNVQEDFGFNGAPGTSYNLNPFFSQVTTNEIGASFTNAAGSGQDLFQVATGLEAPGLGCGQKTLRQADGSRTVPKCWLVVVPRGSATEENPIGFGSLDVVTSPLSPSAWKNRIAIPLTFSPVDSPCTIGAVERRLSGTELALPAIARWQPTLCTTGTLPPYSFANVSDGLARQQLLNQGSGSPGMVVVSQPYDPTALDPSNPVVYAPLTASGIVIGFNLERIPKPTTVDTVGALTGIRVASINLTPRLVAKLLTQSYKAAFAGFTGYSWLADNPGTLTQDPDFIRYNPEWTLLTDASPRELAGLQMPAGASDYAQQVWEWLLSDPEAKAWLDGQPDEFGMKVNPFYSTSATLNSNGVAFGDPAPNSFPKSDPFCYQPPPQGALQGPTLCSTDWMPYQRGLAGAAQVTRFASDGAKVSPNQSATGNADFWMKLAPQPLGTRGIISLTDSPSAANFGLQVAKLSRAGDDADNRTFVGPDAEGLTAGLASMAPRAEPSVLQPSPLAQSAQAYPLTTLVYAATTPLALDTQSRSDFAEFLRYAAGPGQVPGTKFGQLPAGYAPLTPGLAAQVVAAAAAVQSLTPPATTTTTSTSTTTVADSNSTTTVASAPEVVTSSSAATDVASSSVPTTTTRPRSSSSGGATSPTPSSTGGSVPTSSSLDESTTTVAEPGTSDGTGTTIAVGGDPTSGTTPPTTVAAVRTPGVSSSRIRYAVPGIAACTLFSALGALELTKRPRRRRASSVLLEESNP